MGNGIGPAAFGRPTTGRALQVYLLGTLEFDALLALQRRLVYEVAGDRDAAVLILCDHPPGITVGREGSRVHVRLSPEALAARRWPVRWVSRGGGAMLHLPGQVAAYPVISLDRAGVTAYEYLARLQAVACELLAEADVPAVPDPDRPGVRANGRRIAHVGAAVRDGVSSFGLVLNVNPDLDHFRLVHCDGDPRPMTSAERETVRRVRPTTVRQRLAELIADRFGFDRVSLFHTHPTALPTPTRHAAPTRSR